MKRNLKNKIVWITGAGSGIGQNSAITLSKLGMKVILSGRNLETLQEMTSDKDNKTVYLPYEASGILSSLGGIKNILGGN